MSRGFRLTSGARSTAFAGDNKSEDGDESRSQNLANNARWYKRILSWRNPSRVVASHATAQDGGGGGGRNSSSNDKRNNGEETAGLENTSSKPKPLRRSPEWFVYDNNS